MITWPGLTHCRNCGKILEIGEMGICTECEIEENKGKNLFEVNGTKYTDNIPNDITISLTKEQYAEYLQQKELIEKLQKENEELKLKDYYLPAWVTKKYVSKDKIREKLNQEYEEYTNLMKTQQSVETKNIWTYQHNAIKGILEELLEEEE